MKELLQVASEMHGNQKYGEEDYIYHLEKVLELAQKNDTSINVQKACIFHDVLEDTDCSYNDLVKLIGVESADIVYAVTDELGKNREERKRKTYPKIKKSWEATLVKLFDRITNIEHAIETQHKMLSVYIKEYPQFKKALFSSNSPRIVISTWNHLDDLIKINNKRII